jgi:hypothetical protein
MIDCNKEAALPVPIFRRTAALSLRIVKNNVNKRKKFIFDHPILASVWFWPSNFKTGYFWPSNYQNRSNLTIGLFW